MEKSLYNKFREEEITSNIEYIKEVLFPKILEAFPPQETLGETISLFEDIEEMIYNNFKNILIKTKNELLSLNELEHDSLKNTRVVLSSNKNDVQNFKINFKLACGKGYNCPYYDEIIKSLENKNVILLFELVYENEEKANEIIKQIYSNIIPKLQYFPYHKVYQKYGGNLDFFRIKEKLIVTLSRECGILKKLEEIVGDFSNNKFNSGIEFNITFSSNYFINKITNMTIKDFLESLSSFVLDIDIKYDNVKTIFNTFKKYLDEENNNNKEKDSKMFMYISQIILIRSYFLALNINMDLELNIDLVRKVLLRYIFNNNFMIAAYLETKKRDEIGYENLFLILKKCLQYDGISFDKKYFQDLKGYIIFPSNKLILEINSHVNMD